MLFSLAVQYATRDHSTVSASKRHWCVQTGSHVLARQAVPWDGTFETADIPSQRTRRGRCDFQIEPFFGSAPEAGDERPQLCE